MSKTETFPAAGSSEELEAFESLQQQFVDQFKNTFPDRSAWQTVIVVPSMSADSEILRHVKGIQHYEERMLFMLMLLRQPRTRVVLVTSQSIDPAIIDYYLHLLPGIPSRHAKQRLKLLSCHDGSPVALTEKILGRRLLMDRICNEISDPATTHLACFNVTPLERTLAVRLGIPLYGCDPALWHLGTKSGGREIFRNAGVNFPDGRENLHTKDEMVDALTELKQQYPALRQTVVKLNEGISGKGNATFSFQDCPDDDALRTWVADELPKRLNYEAGGETWENFSARFEQAGGVVECFLEANEVYSPSVQGVISPLGEVDLVSTHDQVLGGSGQTYLGCIFPAHDNYRLDIQQAAAKVGQKLAEGGIWGRFAVDFLSIPNDDGGWDNYAIEINIRRGGTTLPYMMLQFLIDGSYDTETGLYNTRNGQPRYYYASDNLHKDIYRGLTPEDLINILVEHNLSFHTAEQQGVVFHLIGSLSEFGKLGALCVADSPERAEELFHHAMAVLDREAEHCALEV